MNQTIENLIIEIINYRNRKPFYTYNTYIIKAHDTLGWKYIISPLGNLIRWIDPLYHTNNTDPDKLMLRNAFMDDQDFKKYHDRYINLFKVVPEFYELFKLKKEHIEFNSELTEKDILEIYCFVRKKNEPRNIMR